MSESRQAPDDEAEAVRMAHLAGDRTGAMTRALAWLETHPADSRMWTTVAAFHRMAGDDAAALGALRRAVTVDPDDLDAWFVYATVPTPPGDDGEERLLAARELIARAPEMSTGYQIAYNVLKARGDLNGGLDFLVTMTHRIPPPGSPLPDLDAQPIPAPFWLASTIAEVNEALEARQWPAVRVTAQLWTQLDPTAPQAWLQRALSEIQAQREHLALPMLHRVIHLDPDEAEGWLLLAHSIGATGGSLADQQAAARRALDLDPDHPQARKILEPGPTSTIDSEMLDHWPSFVAAFATLACLLGWFVAHRGGLGTASPPSRPGQPWAGILLILPALALASTTLLVMLGGGVAMLRAADRTTRYVYGLSVAVTLLSSWLLVAPRELMLDGAAIAYPALWVLTAPLAVGTLFAWRFLTAGPASGKQPTHHP